MRTSYTVFFKGLQIDLNSANPQILWKMLIYSSPNYPIGTQIHLLQDIGLNLTEIQQYLFSDNPKISNKSLPITRSDYIPEMREQLLKIRQNDPNLGIMQQMKELLNYDFNASKNTDSAMRN